MPAFQEQAGNLEELVSAEFGRLREFLLKEEERIKEKLQVEKQDKLNKLEEALTKATEQISQLENTAEQLYVKLEEDDNPGQLKVSKRRGGGVFNCIQVIYSSVFLYFIHLRHQK